MWRRIKTLSKFLMRESEKFSSLTDQIRMSCEPPCNHQVFCVLSDVLTAAETWCVQGQGDMKSDLSDLWGRPYVTSQSGTHTTILRSQLHSDCRQSSTGTSGPVTLIVALLLHVYAPSDLIGFLHSAQARDFFSRGREPEVEGRRWRWRLSSKITASKTVHLVCVIIMYTKYERYKDVVSPRSLYAMFLECWGSWWCKEVSWRWLCYR